MFKAWRKRWRNWQSNRLRAKIALIAAKRAIDEQLWLTSIRSLPFVAALSEEELVRLRILASLFLESKEFSGAQGFEIQDSHAVMVAVQACLPILQIAPPDRPDLALDWYEGFVGIVLHAGEVKARREWVDEDGVAHTSSETLTGEVLEGGPLMLAWNDVANAGHTAQEAYNVVIHEFIHVMDLRDGQPDGCPPMPIEHRRRWLAVLQTEYERFCEASNSWQRFGSLQGSAQPLLDAYGSTSVDEFFAVAAEGYFVQRERFSAEHPALLMEFDGFFLGRGV
jgi:MtfA peptidase